MRWVGCNLLALWLGAASVGAQMLANPIRPDNLRTNAVAATQPQADWTKFVAITEQLLLDAWQQAPKYVAAQRYRTLVENEAVAWALAQRQFVRRVGADKLAGCADTPAKREFLCWLLQQPGALEDFLETVRAEENATEVLRIWSQLWNGDEKGREKYYRLALACAVVFDRKIEWVPALGYAEVQFADRYKYYRNAAENGGLCAPVAELAPYELVWVVDAPVSEAELEWARRNARYSRAQWSVAYAAVAYRMDRAMAGTDPYRNYTLAEIRAKGGICGDQAHFAAVTAKANGIPAMVINGSGERGNHVWFGYKATPQQWNFKAGRYQGDHYTTGYATDPQTGLQIKEQELDILADAQRRQPEWRQTNRLVWLADWLGDAKQENAPREALELAVTICNRHVPAWTALVAQLRAAKVPRPKWDGQLAAFRAAFRPYPDTLVLADTWDTEFVKATGTPKEIDELLRQQQRRLKASGNDRSDLFLETVAKRIAALEERKDIDGAMRVYKQALRDEARELQTFRTVAQQFFMFGERHDRRHETVRAIYVEFRRLPGPTTDPFSQRAYAGLEKLVSDYLERDGQKTQAKALRLQAESRIRATAAGW